ncbi:MAG: hypothetical protein [Wendovervirus sonii]|uniref:Uncharacterized protein n=1 Tax=phage Lak_Megaphage_Sonny TaxID=3109229 RepID=A0ABZ0Z5V7_9CAUD|nr:MAG: hypothetical protein [phage Lak_Megaphage_Sonny]
MIILEIWNGTNHSISPNISYNQYDTEDEVHEAEQMIQSMYLNLPKPSPYNMSHFWGYVILDFENESILADVHDGLQDYFKLAGLYKELKMKDDFFRKDGEIPDGYEWADGEYDGWLQYRWGDGKNAVRYTKAGDKLHISPNEIMFGTVKAVYGTNAKVKHLNKKKLSNIVKEDNE